jgi:hypothetical protein
MNRNIRASLAAVVGFALLAALVGGSAGDAEAQTRRGTAKNASRSDQCCYNNFQFAGTCVVTIGENETCADPLAFLNNFQSVGRQYCRNTQIRGGWTEVPCSSSSTGSGIGMSPSYITPTAPTYVEPVREDHAQPLDRQSTTTGSPTFITPVDPGSSVKASEPGLISL